MESLFHILTLLGVIGLAYGLWWVSDELTNPKELQGEHDGEDHDATTKSN
jgi:hypothetical protein